MTNSHFKDENGNPILVWDTLVVPFEGVDYTGTPFSFPIDSVKTLSADFYNAAIAGPANNFLDSLFGQINGQAPINLGLNSLLPDSDPQLISSIDTINISSGDNSVYSTKIKNRGIPTNLSASFKTLFS